MENFQYPFERLTVFQKSRDLASKVYEMTKAYPDIEKFGLTSQMRRAAVSIISNLAEGSARSSKKDQARFTEIAYSSANELLAQTMISLDLNYIDIETYTDLRSQIGRVTSMLAGLRKAQANDLNEPDSPYQIS